MSRAEVTMKLKALWLSEGHDTLTNWNGPCVPAVGSIVRIDPYAGKRYRITEQEWKGPYLVHLHVEEA